MKSSCLVLLAASLLAGPAIAHPRPALDASIVIAQASNPRLVSSTSINGRTIKVLVIGNGSPRVNLQQRDDNATLKIGAHTIFIAPDGRVSVDGKETSYGIFRELDVTIGDGDTVEVKVAN